MVSYRLPVETIEKIDYILKKVENDTNFTMSNTEIIKLCIAHTYNTIVDSNNTFDVLKK